MAQCFHLPADSLFLGLDSSTQSLKATALDSELRVFASKTVHFDSELPHYNTKDGVHRGSSGRVTAPPLMWVEALELLFDKLQQDSFPFTRVKAISGSGQQHGSVFWRTGALNSHLKSLVDSIKLSVQLEGAFSTMNSPIWMDSSTTEQCRAIEESLGGAAILSTITGSRAYERFTGPQIKKIYEHEQEVYDNTERISLVSSFMASVLVGDYVSIDHSDGGGMNLMDFKKRVWSQEALLATAPGLERKLGNLAASHEVAGKLCNFFVKRYNFSGDCIVIHWSGDNPNSLAGLALDHPGDLAISLGTSDTVFGITSDPQPGLEGHIFPNPVDPSSYMLLLCYKNGSLMRKEVRNRVANGSWEIFNEKLRQSPPLNDGRVGFYYMEQEILPPLPAGVHRFLLRKDVNESGQECFLEADEVQEFEPCVEVRALVEGQFLSMRAHSERRGMPSPPARVIATGGGSANHQLLNTIAEVFGCCVYTTERPDSASLGAALRAAHGWTCHDLGKFVPISKLYKDREGSAVHCKLAAEAGNGKLHSRYSLALTKRMELETKLLKEIFG